MTSLQPVRRAGRHLRWALFGVAALLLMLLFSGCAGGGAPLSSDQFSKLGFAMQAIEHNKSVGLNSIKGMDPREVDLFNSSLKTGPANKDNLGDIDKYDAVTDVQVLNAADLKSVLGINSAFLFFLRGYLAESAQIYNLAIFRYQEAVTAGDSGVASLAHYRLGLLAANGHILGNETPGWISKTPATAQDVVVNEWQTLQRSGSNPLNKTPDVKLWVRGIVTQPGHEWDDEMAAIGGQAVIGTGPGLTPVLYPAVAPAYITHRLDEVYRTGIGKDHLYYQIVGAYVNFFKKYFHVYGAAMALIFLALIIKLVTAPMTSTSFRGMRDMQRVQPLIKELQEKYKDDKQKLATAQMELMKEHQVNPMKGCLPMLIQLPIFWIVYRAVQVYAYGFANGHFLWVSNLAQPDTILLVLYALSMIVTQKLTTAPPTDPQQKAMQTQMTYIMPLMLFFMLASLASAFVLYWFFLNVFSSIQQYYLIRQYKIEDEARAAAAATSLPKLPKKGKQS